jgi:hypothetical protein
MVGSRVAASVAVCDAAVPLSNVVATMAIAEGTTKLNEDFIGDILPKGRMRRPRATTVSHLFNFKWSELFRAGLVEKISADDRRRLTARLKPLRRLLV